MSTKTKLVIKINESILPTIPSALLKLALKDLEAVQKLKTREINMGVWHGLEDGPTYSIPNPKSKCLVCFAGAVMDRTFKVPKNTSVHSTDVEWSFYGIEASDQDKRALLALNEARKGDISRMLSFLRINFCGVGLPISRAMPEFSGKGTKFKKAIRQLIKDLEAVEL